MPKLVKLILLIIVCQLVGIVGAVFTVKSIPIWYAGLIKPSFSPPNYVFGPVWTLLYTLMGIAAYRVIESGKNKKDIKLAMNSFWIQLVLNFMWTPIFFGMHNLFLSLFVIIFLWFYILRTIMTFARVDKYASIFLYPYLLWVFFASVLNFSLFMLNK